jgi:GT2 family glycosyltransferase
MTPHDIGVVVIGRNEGERLVNCLESVNLTIGSIVYVDSGSTDGSTAAAERLGASVIALDMTRPFTAARARNEGFAALMALRLGIRFVQFIDGDCMLAPGWLDSAFAFIKERDDVAVVCGRRRERHPDASVYNWLADLEWNTPTGEAAACGGDSLLRVEAFETAGGFNPRLIAGEEPELCLRLRENGWKIWRLASEMTLHDAAMTRFGQWWIRAVRCGYAYTEVSRLHKSSSFAIWGRETARAAFWGGLLPATICLGAFINSAALWGILAYILQICRVAIMRDATSPKSWIFALFMMVGKFAEFQGILRFHWRRISRQATSSIEYK